MYIVPATISVCGVFGIARACSSSAWSRLGGETILRFAQNVLFAGVKCLTVFFLLYNLRHVVRCNLWNENCGGWSGNVGNSLPLCYQMSMFTGIWTLYENQRRFNLFTSLGGFFE